MIIRREQPADRDAVRAVQVAAFGDGEGEPLEARLLDELRGCDGWIPELSWVALVGGRLAGHGVCTRGHVDETPCVGLGPIGVIPAAQRAGVGSAVMHALIGAADALGEPMIALLGEPAYYATFGFTPAADHGISPPDLSWGAYFQVLRLSAWTDSITGTFRYAAPFATIS